MQPNSSDWNQHKWDKQDNEQESHRTHPKASRLRVMYAPFGRVTHIGSLKNGLSALGRIRLLVDRPVFETKHHDLYGNAILRNGKVAG